MLVIGVPTRKISELILRVLYTYGQKQMYQ